jgi:hypothetical protein
VSWWRVKKGDNNIQDMTEMVVVGMTTMVVTATVVVVEPEVPVRSTTS